MDDAVILDIHWRSGNIPNLPRMVGPFTCQDEAVQWAHLNARRSLWQVHPLTFPYLRSGESLGKGGNNARI
ncbi:MULTISPECIES: hypothetical protein [Mycobacteriaceae]|jgi:hypothetical protein|uniref:Uncharacterized protein n=2 Tax=Mycolicibacterium TaxID=1866885 RepID=A0ABR5FQE2_9MYCO|nr:MULTISPECIES: hypothetical protein [Mycobacteriaceae]KLI04163.1 hypothetical protein AA982_31530 [Mycolicibacterium senegalense]KLO50158.1 hypothetical protein ABW05_00070 [Mycolicibacterium senegalense]OLT94299.1 hypothetical protein BKG60_18405 [Mycobacterium syngnathidarum]